jgi:hypothetical protein
MNFQSCLLKFIPEGIHQSNIELASQKYIYLFINIIRGNKIQGGIIKASMSTMWDTLDVF